MKPRRHSVFECVLPFCISFALEIPTAWPAMEYEAPMQRRPSVTRSRSIFDRRPSDRSNAPSMDRRHSLHKHRKGPSPQARGVRGRGHKVSWYLPLQIVWKSKGCHNSSWGSFPKTYMGIWETKPGFFENLFRIGLQPMETNPLVKSV